MRTESTNKMRISLSTSGFSTYSLRIQLTIADFKTAQFKYTHAILCVCGLLKLFWIPQRQLRNPQIRQFSEQL